MKVIKASQLIYSIYEGEEQQEIEISAIRVNRLCQRMRIKDIFCELNTTDFEELLFRYPDEISMTDFEVRVMPNSNFSIAIQNEFRFDSNILSNNELLRYWEETDE